MDDAANTPEEKELQNSAPEAGKEIDEGKADSGQAAARPEADTPVITGLAAAPDAVTKLVAPDAVPAAAPKHEGHGHSHDHSHDHSDDAHGHSHDAHDAKNGHAHDDHPPVATDVIPETSWQDQLLSGLSMGVLLSFVWLVYTWYATVPLAPVTAEAPLGAMQQH